MSAGAKLNQALAHLDRGDWPAAHTLLQNDTTAAACWVHGIVHVMEGDFDNARYWYGRAGRTFSQDSTAEIAAAKETLA